MALKTVVSGNKSGNFIRMNDLEIGQSVAGYLLGTAGSTKYKGSFLIKLLTKDNEVVTVTSNGTLAKLEEQIDAGDVTLNIFTEFTKVSTYVSKKQMDSETGEFRVVSVFDIAQDSDDLVSDEDAATALAADEEARQAATAAKAAAPAPAARPAPSANRGNVRR